MTSYLLANSCSLGPVRLLILLLVTMLLVASVLTYDVFWLVMS